MRRLHPAWGPSRICWELEREGREPLPGRSMLYRMRIYQAAKVDRAGEIVWPPDGCPR